MTNLGFMLCRMDAAGQIRRTRRQPHPGLAEASIQGGYLERRHDMRLRSSAKVPAFEASDFNGLVETALRAVAYRPPVQRQIAK